MKRLIANLKILAICVFISSFYGIINDQITYSISDEYYSKFKFYQFGLLKEGESCHYPHPRIQVSIIGVRATWWFGLISGLLFILIGIFKKSKIDISEIIKALGIVVSITLVVGIIGLVYSLYFLDKNDLNWSIPHHIFDVDSFITVGSIHNFSYAGAQLGTMLAILYLFFRLKK